MEKKTPTPWMQRKHFTEPFLVKDEGREWYANSIDIHDQNGRIICGVQYMTDVVNNGWGQNETIDKWEANAQFIVTACNSYDSLVEQNRVLREALETAREFIETTTKDMIKGVIPHSLDEVLGASSVYQKILSALKDK